MAVLIPLLLALLAAPADSFGEETGAGTAVGTFLADLATAVDPEAGPPDTGAGAVARLQAAGFPLPESLAPGSTGPENPAAMLEKPLTLALAGQMLAAAGLGGDAFVDARPLPETILTPAQVAGLLRLLPLAGARGGETGP